MSNRISAAFTRLAAIVLMLACGTAGAIDEKAKAVAAHPPTTKAKGAAAAKSPPLVDINSASKEQLKTLPMITDVEADKIIAGRPYLSKAFLTTEKVIPDGIYVAIKGKIVAKQSLPQKTTKQPKPVAKQ